MKNHYVKPATVVVGVELESHLLNFSGSTKNPTEGGNATRDDNTGYIDPFNTNSSAKHSMMTGIELTDDGYEDVYE